MMKRNKEMKAAILELAGHSHSSRYSNKAKNTLPIIGKVFAEM